MVDDNRSGAWQLSILVIPGGLLVITYETTDHKEQEKVIKALAAKGFKERKASTVTMVETQLGPTRKFSNGKKEVQLFAYSMDNAVYYTLNIGPANIK